MFEKPGRLLDINYCCSNGVFRIPKDPETNWRKIYSIWCRIIMLYAFPKLELSNVLDQGQFQGETMQPLTLGLIIVIIIIYVFTQALTLELVDECSTFKACCPS